MGTDGVAPLTAVCKIDKLHGDREGRIRGKMGFKTKYPGCRVERGPRRREGGC